jgi:hypothetical protein
MRTSSPLPLVLVLALAAACGGGSSQAQAGDAGADAVRDAHLPPPVADALPPVTGPDRLSQTGLYSDIAARALAPGVIAFEPRWQLWSDGAEKRRWIWVPPGQKIDTSDVDHFRFPVGTKAWKEFRSQGKTVETRILQKVREGKDGWWQIAYVWLPDESDAIASVAAVKDAQGTFHDVPEQAACPKCHENVADGIIGFSAFMLSSPNGNGALTQLAGLFTNPPPAELQPPGDALDQEALGYLHANCGHCHSDETPKLSTQSPLRLRLLSTDKTLADTGLARTTRFALMQHPMQHPPYGQATMIVVPGVPHLSGLWLRMIDREDEYAMPPLATEVLDPVGAQTIYEWIARQPCGSGCTIAPAR